MTTGYTAKLHSGDPQTPAEFILSCSRAFGATIHQRDENGDEPPRLRELDTTYYDQALATARETLARDQKWTVDEAATEARVAYEKNLDEHTKSEKNRRDIQKRYEGMLTQIRKWTPPTKEHVEFKRFMIEQLESSIKFDCTPYPRTYVLQTGEEYRAARIAEAERSITYYLEQIAKEVERVESANRWITSLYDSLPKED